VSIAFEALRFFSKVPFTEFLFGTTWSPQMAIRADQVGASGSFGAVPLFAGTLLISAIAMLVAAPIGLLSAIYLAEYARRKIRSAVKPLLEVLARTFKRPALALFTEEGRLNCPLPGLPALLTSSRLLAPDLTDTTTAP
jgi:ABC-type phosphate/phosphonate transport system permease subunit